MSKHTLPWDDVEVRAAFPALGLTDHDKPRLYADAPGGTQVAARALTRLHASMVNHCANDGGAFRTSQLTDAGLIQAHAVAATFLGADPDEVVFGLNTTSQLFNFSRMISRAWQSGDEIVLSRMDHDANIAPWLIAAQERGVTVRWLEFDVQSFQYRYDTLSSLINSKTSFIEFIAPAGTWCCSSCDNNPDWLKVFICLAKNVFSAALLITLEALVLNFSS